MFTILEETLIDALRIQKQNISKDWNDAKERYELQTKRFRAHFDLKRLNQLSIDEYVAGNGNHDSFCYQIEHGCKAAGSIKGPSISRFGVYFSKKAGSLKATKYLGGDVEKGFEKVKRAIIHLVMLNGPISESDYKAISLSNMLKNKILHIYHPEDYLSVYSPDHLSWLCREFGIHLEETSSIVAHNWLLDFKRKHHEFSKLSNWEFGNLIYRNAHPSGKSTTYGEYQKKRRGAGGEPKGDGTEGSESFVMPVAIEISELSQIGAPYQPRIKGKRPYKGDYGKTGMQKRQIGARGENLVMCFLDDQWTIEGRQFSIIQTSIKDDAAGYDLECVVDGETIYIEVKATTLPIQNAAIYMTENERLTALDKGDSYYIYFVSEIDNEPKITWIRNPFGKKSQEVKARLSAVKHRLSIGLS